MAQNESSGTVVMVQGRIVWASGDLFKGQHKTDANTRQPLYKTDGSPVIEYGFGLAIPKTEFAPGRSGEALMAAMQNEAAQIYPSRQFPPGFAWKFKDGDGVDHNGAPFSQREGYAGHLVFALTTRITIKYFRHENGNNIMIDSGIKVGDYVQVQVQIKAHPAVGNSKPGLYMNPNAALFIGYGKEIVNTPSGDQIFGTQAPPLMGSATPLAPSSTPLVPSGMPMQQASPAMPGMMQQPAAQPSYAPPVQQVPPQQPAPYYGVLPQAHQPQGVPQGNGLAPGVAAQPQGYPQAAYAGAPAATPGNYPQQQQQVAPAPAAAPQGFPAMPGMPGFPGQQ